MYVCNLIKNIFNHKDIYCTEEALRAKSLLIKILGHVKKFAVALFFFLHKTTKPSASVEYPLDPLTSGIIVGNAISLHNYILRYIYPMQIKNTWKFLNYRSTFTLFTTRPLNPILSQTDHMKPVISKISNLSEMTARAKDYLSLRALQTIFNYGLPLLDLTVILYGMVYTQYPSRLQDIYKVRNFGEIFAVN